MSSGSDSGGIRGRYTKELDLWLLEFLLRLRLDLSRDGWNVFLFFIRMRVIVVDRDGIISLDFGVFSITFSVNGCFESQIQIPSGVIRTSAYIYNIKMFPFISLTTIFGA